MSTEGPPAPTEAAPVTRIRHCRPDCRSCEASERLLRAAELCEKAGIETLADALGELAVLAGQKSYLGRSIAEAILTQIEEVPRS